MRVYRPLDPSAGSRSCAVEQMTGVYECDGASDLFLSRISHPFRHDGNLLLKRIVAVPFPYYKRLHNRPPRAGSATRKFGKSRFQRHVVVVHIAGDLRDRPAF